jgi:hypothetical protein
MLGVLSLTTASPAPAADLMPSKNTRHDAFSNSHWDGMDILNNDECEGLCSDTENGIPSCHAFGSCPALTVNKICSQSGDCERALEGWIQDFERVWDERMGG